MYCLMGIDQPSGKRNVSALPLGKQKAEAG